MARFYPWPGGEVNRPGSWTQVFLPWVGPVRSIRVFLLLADALLDHDLGGDLVFVGDLELHTLLGLREFEAVDLTLLAVPFGRVGDLDNDVVAFLGRDSDCLGVGVD